MKTANRHRNKLLLLGVLVALLSLAVSVGQFRQGLAGVQLSERVELRGPGQQKSGLLNGLFSLPQLIRKVNF